MSSTNRPDSDDIALEWLATIQSAGEDSSVLAHQETLAGIMKQTVPPTFDMKLPAADRASIMLDRVVSAHRLEMGETLGEGGMGIVRSARQADLGRDVAVKMLHKEASSDKAVLAMLREAWVTGTLEHPNIVPIYFVDVNADNEPRIVLKRIEGITWSSLIGDADEVKKRFGSNDLLEWNLGVLIKVLDAIRYAHNRGVLHRDLKPDNVMLGKFGEVYVVDWGIALALEDDDETLLPLASNVQQMAGTPAYMAPEMLGDGLDRRTDVYLLGGMLYQILCDAPPHLGTDLESIIESIRDSKPKFPKSAPRSLCKIVQKAMEVDPEDRYQSAESVSNAIKKYIEHRGSLRLSRQARHLLGILDENAKAGEPTEALHALWTECRFAFRSALEAWPGNLEARQGLNQGTEIVAEVELRRGDPKVAASILRELKTPSADLAGRVANALEQARVDEARMAHLGQQLDKNIGQHTRVLILSILGLAWMGIELWGQLSGNIERLATHQAMLIGSLVSFVVLMALLVLARKPLMQTMINRQFAAALSVLLGCQIVLSSVAPNIGLSPKQAQVLWILLWAVIAWMVALTIEKRTWPLALGTTVSFIVAGLWIDYRIYAMMGATAAMVINGAVIWWPTKSSRTPA